ncbi:RNA-binding protein 23 [Actinidia chinensis var. chinensis]|uniref:RNA-binding protein 23 n=1 Tax=Actinidia chinensis var. chinensis TaxID=1590841 RepID=A0A2R6R179_ACTCC|nr:RNA-binding protein 23 [Actinidia chinensis var. chinensis]
MFDPKLEMEPDFDSEIKEDVQGECSKFGSLNPIYKEKYIEFFDAMSVPIAIALSGQPLLGQPVMIKNHPKLEKKLVQPITSAAVAVAAAAPYLGGVRKHYVGNLHLNMKEDQFRQFARLEDARVALNLNGQLEIVGHLMPLWMSFI